MFAPGNDTLHAVRLRYDHRAYQRTQIYGNLWSKDQALIDLPVFRYRDLPTVGV